MAITLNGDTGIDLPVALPVSEGGTGLTSVGTSGQVLTSNGTGFAMQDLPAGGVTSLNGETGAITNTAVYAIGSYISGRPQDQAAYNINDTVAGSSLYNVSLVGCRYATNWRFAGSGGANTVGATLINTGTWRCISPCLYDATYTVAYSGLWVRIS